MPTDNDVERLVVMLEARLTDFERNMMKAAGISRTQFNAIRKNSQTATQRMEDDIRHSTNRINQMLASTSAKIGSYGKAFAGGLLGGIAAGGLAGIIQQIGDASRGIAEIGDKAKMAGLSTDAFQELGYVAKANRIEVDALSDGMKEMALRADEYIATGKGSAAESFKRLGFTAEELKKKLADPSALFTEIIGKLGKLDKAAQIRISDELFGGTAGEKFVQLIQQGEEGIRNTISEARRLGLVIDNEVIEAAAELDRKFNAVAVTVGTVLKTAIVEAATQLQKFIDQFRAFDQRSTATLKDRFSELQTRYGQLKNEKGGLVDVGLSFIGKDTASEAKAIQAEMDQVAAELRKRATPILREKLAEQNAANTPYTPPPATGGRKSSGNSVTKKTADDRFDEDIQTVRDRIAALGEEQAALGLSFEAQQKRRVALDLEQQALRQVREEARRNNDENWQSVQLSETQKRKIEEVSAAYAKQAEALRQAQEAQDLQRDALKGALSDFRSAWADGKIEAEEWGDIVLNVLDKVIDKFENDLVDAIFQANNAGGGGGFLQSLIGGFSSLFGGGGGSSSIPWAQDLFRANGGPVNAGQPYIVGERRPELFVPDQPGTILPYVPSPDGASGSPQTVEMNMTVVVQGSGDKELMERMQSGAEQIVGKALQKFAKSPGFATAVAGSLPTIKLRGMQR